MKTFIIVLIIIILAWVGYFLWSGYGTVPDIAEMPIATAMYACDEGKTIAAEFYAATSTAEVTPGEMPQPGGRVVIKLSDGRTLSLTQTVSADGSRYSDGNPTIENGESVVFWSKGNGALVLENNLDQTYIGCIEVVPDPGNLPQTFASSSEGFSMRYPAGYSVAPYQYTIGPGKTIHGVKFTIPDSVAAGTNLSSDTYFSVETIPETLSCDPAMFLSSGPEGKPASTAVSENGTDYLVASTTEAAAGNLYEEIVYTMPGTNMCVGVRYFIHYGVLENYPVGTVSEFDRSALLGIFDSMRRTVTIGQ